MTTRSKLPFILIAAVPAIMLLCAFSFLLPPDPRATDLFPYEQAGLTKRQAAVHLLSRLTYGATPGQVDEVVKTGLEKWFKQQLEARVPDNSLNNQLNNLEILTLSNTEIAQHYQRNARILRMAVKEGVINPDSVDKTDKKAYREKLAAYAKEKGLKPQYQLIKQFQNQKLLRALYSQNQLQEVMTEFWFNHFNVSFTKAICAPFIPSYERDVIRPNALGKFEALLIATAKSPAMLLYLDNAGSTGPEMQIKRRIKEDSLMRKAQQKKLKGLNENYAREVMELHTLGVDGGYTQKDVTEAARILTGWTTYPMGNTTRGQATRKRIKDVGEDKQKARGFVHEGDFIFIPDRHDKGEKTVMGNHFSSGGGYEEGLALLSMLARHPSTSDFICRKIAIRFVHDNPSQNLVDRMSKTFRGKNGDIRQVLTTLVYSPEFWSAEAVREKTKSPFELSMSALRSLDAAVKQPQQLVNWIDRMGQKIYYYQAPTGFPDKGQYWINTGSLLNRMNFGLALASGRIPGVQFDLHKLNNNHEPESTEEALQIYCRLMLPERNLNETIARLTPLLNDPGLPDKIDNAADQANKPEPELNAAMKGDNEINKKQSGNDKELSEETEARKMKHDSYRLSQVVGIIIGSPEFQRR